MLLVVTVFCCFFVLCFCFFLMNLWSSSPRLVKTEALTNLSNMISLQSREEHICALSINSWSSMNSHELRACTLIWLVILIRSWKRFISSDIMFVYLAFLYGWYYVETYSETTSLTQKVKPEVCLVMSAILIYCGKFRLSKMQLLSVE